MNFKLPKIERKTNWRWSLVTLVFLSLVAAKWGVKAVWAGPRMFLDPATGSYSSDFQVVLKIDTETETVKASEALLDYDTTRLGVVSVVLPANPFFREMGYDVNEEGGELLIYNYEMDMFGKTGTGDLAVITFSVLGSGTAEVNFVCEAGVTTDSNMSGGENSEDLIDCASVGSGSYTLASSGTVVSTATPTTALSASTATPTTASSASTATPTTASELPETGFALPSVLLTGGGLMLLLFALFVWL
jgi:hypothetical protein